MMAAFAAMSLPAWSQVRYVDDIFTDAQITVTTNQVFDVNYNRYVSPSQVPGGGTKVTPIIGDVYMPDPAVDNYTNRPVIIFSHTGTYLPECTIGPGGGPRDSAMVRLARAYAKKGFVAISLTYRIGWDPVNSNNEITRATNLLAVYLSIQDMKWCVRAIRAQALQGGNPLGIDPTYLVLWGNGSGGYTVMNYGVLDKYSEYTVPTKFHYAASGTGIFGQPVTAGDPYIDTSYVGDIDGFGAVASITGVNPAGLPIIDETTGKFNVITPQKAAIAAVPTDVSLVINAGGAMGAITWLEAGEPAQVSFHNPLDPFAPYDSGTVFITKPGVGLAPVVDNVSGSLKIQTKATALGNNACLVAAGFADPYTVKAQSSPFNPGQLTTLNPMYRVNTSGNPAFVNNAPWDFWDPALTAATCPGLANPQANPNNKALSLAAIDTMVQYATPRIAAQLTCQGLPIGMEEYSLAANHVKVFPNPASEAVTVELSVPDVRITRTTIADLTGRVVATQWHNGMATAQVDLTSVSRAGIYLITVETSHGEVTRKLTITR